MKNRYVHLSNERVEAGERGFPRCRRYLSACVPIWNATTDIAPDSAQAHQRLGCPMQKLLAPLEWIIQASSSAGDVVPDPFCGCCTAIAAAQKLGRQRIGIDVTRIAIVLVKNRLSDIFQELGEVKTIGGLADKTSACVLAQADRCQFAQAGGKRGKKGAHSSVNGIINFFSDDSSIPERISGQVRSDELSTSVARELHSVLEREGAQMALLMTSEPPSADVLRESASLGEYARACADERYPRTANKQLLAEGARPHVPLFSSTVKRTVPEKRPVYQTSLV